MIDMEGVSPAHAKAAAIRAEMQHADPYERPDNRPDDGSLEHALARVRRQWQRALNLQACWRI